MNRGFAEEKNTRVSCKLDRKRCTCMPQRFKPEPDLRWLLASCHSRVFFSFHSPLPPAAFWQPLRHLHHHRHFLLVSSVQYKCPTLPVPSFVFHKCTRTRDCNENVIHDDRKCNDWQNIKNMSQNFSVHVYLYCFWLRFCRSSVKLIL